MLSPLPLVAILVVLLLWAEWLWPLRRRRESTVRRVGRNAILGAMGAVTVRICELPLIIPLASFAEARGWGILGELDRLGLPSVLRVPLALLLMDYTLYLWHVLNHLLPVLWRFHVVHHLDRDMDASTAIRFHFGEHLLSVPWRAAQVALIGIGPSALAVWQLALFVEIVFHHSNLRLPIGLERWLSRIIVTPRIHGIHHSAIENETNSNWSSGLTLWDRLHGTLRLAVPQREIDIGVPAYRTPAQLKLRSVLVQPLQHQPPQWIEPDGTTPVRVNAGLSATQLAP